MPSIPDEVLVYILILVAATILAPSFPLFVHRVPRLGAGFSTWLLASSSRRLRLSWCGDGGTVDARGGYRVQPRVALMLVIRRLAAGAESGSSAQSAGVSGLLVTVGIDLVVDGLLLGIGFATRAETDVLITITLEVLFLGLAAASTLTATGRSRAQVILIPSGVALPILLGVSGIADPRRLGGLTGFTFTLVVVFGVAALLYLVTEELLVEAHGVRETPPSTALFFIGFLVLMLVRMAGM